MAVIHRAQPDLVTHTYPLQSRRSVDPNRAYSAVYCRGFQSILQVIARAPTGRMADRIAPSHRLDCRIPTYLGFDITSRRTAPDADVSLVASAALPASNASIVSTSRPSKKEDHGGSSPVASWRLAQSRTLMSSLSVMSFATPCSQNVCQFPGARFVQQTPALVNADTLDSHRPTRSRTRGLRSRRCQVRLAQHHHLCPEGRNEGQGS